MYQIPYGEVSPALCNKKLDEKLNSIIEECGAREGVVIVKGDNNFRFQVDADYKGNRKNAIEPDIKDRIERLYEYANTFAFQAHNGEADDYCGIFAAEALAAGKSYVISHIDKDLKCIPGWHHNFRTGEIEFIDEEQAYFFTMIQMLTGDSTDNIKGIKGVGPITARKLMAQCPREKMLSRLFNLWYQKVGEDWKEPFLKCVNCIYIRNNVDDLRPLTIEELMERLSWTTPMTMDTGWPSPPDLQMHLDSYMQSLGQPEDNTSEENNS